MAKIQEFLPRFAWCFGPGENKKGHSFTLTGEGVLHYQLLAEFWNEQAPTLPGWTFYGLRQPRELITELQIDGRSFDPDQLLFIPQVDCERKRIDLAVYHPLFSDCTEEQSLQALFILLDDALGERGTQRWVSKIDILKQTPDGPVPIAALGQFFADTISAHGWETNGLWFDPEYELPKSDVPYLRSDVGGISVLPTLTRAYWEGRGVMQDLIPGTGADFVFLRFDNEVLLEAIVDNPEKDEAEVYTDALGDIALAMNKALEAEASGREIGFAFDDEFAYVDLLIYDGANSIDIIRRVSKEQNLPKGTMLHYFATKRGKPQRIR